MGAACALNSFLSARFAAGMSCIVMGHIVAQVWYNFSPHMKPCKITIDGMLPRAFGLSKLDLRAAAVAFAAKSSARVGVPFRAVTIVLQGDAASAKAHEAINGAAGPTDVITQGYDAMPGEEPGIYGELYVNVDQARRVAPKCAGWSAAKELLLYVAHGMDHLSGADDLDEKGYARMRRRELGWLKGLMLSALLLLGLPLRAETDEERFFTGTYAEVVGQAVFPQGGGDMGRHRAGAAVRLGKNLTPYFATELEVAALEDMCGLAWRNVWHVQGWEWFGKLFGYERFDPFLAFGVRGWLVDGDVGPFVGVGALYYLDDHWALRFDGDATLGLESDVEMVYSISAGLQYTF